jgi:hypothetical protein
MRFNLSTSGEGGRAPWSSAIELTGPTDRFSLDIDFADRFQGFAPVVPPTPRPLSAVQPRGTVAYWRFDQAGLAAGGIAGGIAGASVPVGTVARDLTGRGNDLTVSLLNSSGPDALTWSAEHHPGAPAHASLRFDGGQCPDRGAILQTGPSAPINRLKFTSGYTIEAFLKLPDPFEGNHAWMGILSWQGRSGDAGKTNGYSPDEPTCSVNLSGERFLQYVVYPAVQDPSPTSPRTPPALRTRPVQRVRTSAVRARPPKDPKPESVEATAISTRSGEAGRRISALQEPPSPIGRAGA